ncbi:MAG: hypothetical protein E7277_08890 [Lachnospiraceae bacterium]|nr:hypothetical protein [Lachnospiraceae bacterium]
MKNQFFKSACAVATALTVAAGSFTLPLSIPATTANAASITSLFAGGKGTQKNPYQIKTVKQFSNIGKNKTTLKAHYVLKNDLNLKNKTFKSIGRVTGKDMMKGDFSGSFSGTFDGKGHTIQNVTIVQEKNEMGSGLFDVTTGTVKNLKLKNMKASSKAGSRYASCGVGMAYGGTISKITLSGKNSVRGVNCVGGIVGGLWGATVKNCNASGVTVTLEGNNNFLDGLLIQQDEAECGGIIVGGGFTGIVTGCKATGIVKASGNEPVGMGGVAGCLQCMDSVIGNTANVTIQAKNGHAIGGLCGYAGVGDDGDGTVQAPALIKDNHVTVKITADGATHVGGLIGTGLYYFGMEDRFNVVDCSVKGSIDGATTPGTVAGRATNSIITSCNTDVTVNGEKSDVQIGTTSQLYQSSDQYEDGSKEAAAILLKNLEGSYTPLFETLCKDEYDALWMKYAEMSVGKENARATVDALKHSMLGTLTGPEAEKAFKDKPDAIQFNCGFLSGMTTFKVDGNVISGYDKNGKELFSHTYTFEKLVTTAEGMGFYSYHTTEANAGEYEYFLLAGDTPSTTYHTEFRHGSNPDELVKLMTGSYAYWLSAGISKDADAAMIDNCIRLFVIENTKKQ